jgi:hypothetical protein
MPRAISCSAKLSPRHAKISWSPPSNSSFRNAARHTPPAPATASPSPAQTHLQPFQALGMVAPARHHQARGPIPACPISPTPARPRGPRHRPRPHPHPSQARQHLNRARRSAPRHQGGRRRYLDRQLHALRSRLHRLAAENHPATLGQPSRPKDVTHVLGTFRYLCLRRTGHMRRVADGVSAFSTVATLHHPSGKPIKINIPASIVLPTSTVVRYYPAPTCGSRREMKELGGQ